MIPRSVKAPTIPIAFHKLLKVVAVVDRSNPQTQQLLDHIRAENYEVEVCDHFKRDLSEDASVGAYIALVDGDRRDAARAAARGVRALGFRTPLWALADSHRISDVAVLGMNRRGRRLHLPRPADPAYYAKQVIASLVDYGLSLLPPFFGGLMAYDAAANIAFACPGHQGGQFYRKSPTGQIFFKYFGESIFRNDLCNADVDLGDLLIHEGPAAQAQKEAAKVFGADRTYFVLNGTSTSNKVRDQRGAQARRPGAVRPQQPQVATPGRAGRRRCDSGLPADGAKFIRHDRRGRLGRLGRNLSARADPQQPTGHRPRAPQGRAAVPPGLHPALHLRRHDLQRAEGVGEDRPPVRLRAMDEAWIGYNAFHPLFENHSPMRLTDLGPEMAGLFSTQSVHKQGAGFSQASQIHKRDEHIHDQKRYINTSASMSRS